MFPRICTCCGESKERMAFYAHSKSAGGRMTKCKECVKAAVRAYRDQNIEKVRAYDRNRPNAEVRKLYARENAWKYAGRSIEWRKRNPEKYAAHVALNNAVRGGKVLKPSGCECCGMKRQLEGHHDDYAKVLDVVWLCEPCHGNRHKALNAQKRALA
jgi:hypothetical protein